STARYTFRESARPVRNPDVAWGSARSIRRSVHRQAPVQRVLIVFSQRLESFLHSLLYRARTRHFARQGKERMLRDGYRGGVELSREVGSSGGGTMPRRSERRKLPFGRGGVLRVDGRNHIVGIVDVSVGGAYLATRTTVAPSRTLCLKLRLPSGV